ncbi:7219_t:CDS:2 [Funneliformis geosporum]|nr:7219_t:CDS:2 [Funneliformis geosporum]
MDCENNHRWEAIPNSIQQANMGNVFQPSIKVINCHYYGITKQKIITMYLGLPSENRRQDFLKIPEHSKGLELDIYYPEYGFAIEVQYLVFFHRGDPNHVIKQQVCDEYQINLRYILYYEGPYIVIPEHLRELGLIE